jgi:hypothetical protein
VIAQLAGVVIAALPKFEQALAGLPDAGAGFALGA